MNYIGPQTRVQAMPPPAQVPVMTRTLLVLVCALFLIPPSVSAQEIAFSSGLLNLGPLYPEVTRHVRAGTNGQDLYFGVRLSTDIGRGFAATGMGMTMPTQIQHAACAQTPCERLNRFNFRLDHAGSEEMQFTVIGVLIGRSVGPLTVAAGPTTNTMHNCRYGFYGACPMLTLGAAVEARVEVQVGALRAGLEAGMINIPFIRDHYTVLADLSGCKEVGRDFDQCEPITIRPLYLGVTLGAPLGR